VRAANDSVLLWRPGPAAPGSAGPRRRARCRLRMEDSAEATSSTADEQKPHRMIGAGASRVGAETVEKCNSPAAAEAQPEKEVVVRRTKVTKPLTLRQKIYATMEDPGFDGGIPGLPKVISIVLMLVILISVICFIMESEVKQPETGTTGFLPFDPFAYLFYYVEWVSVVIFTLEYNIRLVTTERPVAFVLNVPNIIDLIAWAPFWITGFAFGFNAPDPTGTAEGFEGGLGFVRAVRLFRVFRVFKFGKYSLGISMFLGAMKHSIQPLAILAVLLTVSMIIFSSLMWLFEYKLKGMVDPEILAESMGQKMQEVCFGTIPSAFWWALVTMTTVGYGDCYPITVIGKFLTVFAMIFGVLALALPITVIGSNFAKMVEMYADEDNFAATDLDENGTVEEIELREFIVTMKREGLVRRDLDLKVATLMAKYDLDLSGSLNRDEFHQLKRDVLIDKPQDTSVELEKVNRALKEQGCAIDSILEKLERLEKRLDPEGHRLQSA